MYLLSVSGVRSLAYHCVAFPKSECPSAENLLQWEKLRKTGALPHLARWYDFVMTDPDLQSVAEQHGPKKPTTRKEYVKEVAAAGMGGGGKTLLVG